MLNRRCANYLIVRSSSCLGNTLTEPFLYGPMRFLVCVTVASDYMPITLNQERENRATKTGDKMMQQSGTSNR